MNTSSAESEEDELFDIPPEDLQPSTSPFNYTDPLLLTGVLRAVVENDLDKLKYLIEEDGRCPTINDNHGNTALHIAALNNSSDIAKYLLSLRFDIIDARNFYGETALFLAVNRGHLDLVKTLTDANANVNIANLECITPLHKAAHNPEIAHLLIQNGANVDARDADGEAPLHAAVCVLSDSLEVSKCCEVVCMLLYYNADANLQCSSGRTPFIKALILHRDDIQSILLDYIADFNDPVHEGIPILGWALIHESPFVEYILEAGASVNYKHTSSNAVVACLQTTNIRHFKIIWKKFKYQKLENNKTYLDILIDYLTDDELFEYLQVIIDSNNLKPLFRHFESNPIFVLLLKNMIPSWLNTTCKLMHLYLCEGHTLSVWTLFRVFWVYGYNELFYVCLHMDFKEENTTLRGHIPILLYQPDLSMVSFKNIVAFRLLHLREVSVKEYLPHIRLLSVNKPELRETDWRLMQLPSLLELSRNQAREYLVYTFGLNTSKKYVFFIKTLNLPTHCKDILIFKRPVYFFFDE